MPTYFFDTYDDGEFMRDEVGLDFASLQEARDQAASLLPDLIRQEAPPREHQQFAVVVRDFEGRPVYGATMIFQGRWRLPDDAGWAPCIDALHPSYSPLATVRGKVLASAARTIDASRTKSFWSHLSSLEMQDLIQLTRTTVEASRATLER